MARLRVARRAEYDITQILGISLERWGVEAQRRYAALIGAAMRVIAADPEGPLTRDRRDIFPALRSLHLRHARRELPGSATRAPVHIVYFRVHEDGSVEIGRVLHERMEPGRHMGADWEE